MLKEVQTNLQSSIGISYSSIWPFELHKNTSWKLKQKKKNEENINVIVFLLHKEVKDVYNYWVRIKNLWLHKGWLKWDLTR